MLVPFAGRGTNGRMNGRWRQAAGVRRPRLRRAARTARRVLAAGLGPVVAAGMSLVPAAAVTGAVAGAAAVASVAHAPAAKAATSGSVLILASSVNGGSSSAEAEAATADGYTPVMETASAWDAMTSVTAFAAAFAGYKAVIIGDPSATTCSSTPDSDALGNKADWGPAISGNVAVLGTAPALAGSAGTALMQAAIAYAASASSGTGLYISLNCDYAGTSFSGDASLLDGLSGGGFTATGHLTGAGPACTDSGTVNTWEAQDAAGFAGFTSASLAASSWGSTACPVQESFSSWPANFTPVAYDTAATPASYTASDGVSGQAYVLLGTPSPTAQTLSLTPSTGGAEHASVTETGGSNAAAPGLTQAVSAPDNSGAQGSGSSDSGVNTENGDYTQSAADLSVPAYGPGLGFTRTYDSLAGQQAELTGTPGVMGYGWTDTWASSLSASSPIPGDIYAIDGLAGAANTETQLDWYAGNGLAPGSAAVGAPGGVLYSGGNEYIADTQGNRVLEIPGTTGTQWGVSMPVAGVAYTIAGSYTGQVNPWNPVSATGTGALLAAPKGLAMDSSGDLFIADSGGDQVDEMKPSGAISTIAGTGTGGDGVPATQSALSDPSGVAVDSAGDVYIADSGDNRVQEVFASGGTEWGQSMTAGDVYTVAGSAAGTSGDTGNGTASASSRLDDPQGVAVNTYGIYIADTGNCKVALISQKTGTYWGVTMTEGDEYALAGTGGSCGAATDGGKAVSSKLDDPDGITIGGDGLYIADTGSAEVQEDAGFASTQYGQTMAADDIYDIAGTGTAGNTGNGGAAISAELDAPAATAVDASTQNFYIADAGSNLVRQVSATTADISLSAGDGQDLASAGNGGPAVNGQLVRPGGEIADSHGDIYVTDSDNNRVQEIAAYTHTQWGIPMAGGDVYTIAGSAYGVGGNSGDKGPATSALLALPQGLAFDASGNLLIADYGNNQVRVIAAGNGTFYGQSMTAGDIYTIAGLTTGAAGAGGDGAAATLAGLDNPYGLAVDPAGDVYIADKANNRIQEIYEGGQSGQEWGNTGWTAGDIYTVAGSSAGTSGDSGDKAAATSALLDAPQGLAVDAAGDLIIADTANEQVRMIPVATGTYYGQPMHADDIYTLAGSTAGTASYGGDGFPATDSLLHTPLGLALDPAGDLYIADAYNNRIREIANVSGTAWETQMTADDIYTIAGTGTASSTGNGDAANMATVYFAVSTGTDNYGDLYIGDQSGGQLREVTSASPATIEPAPGLPSALYPPPGSTIGGTTYAAGVTVTQPGGAQITFYPQTSSGVCAQPMVVAGGYCVMPLSQGASLTANGTTSWAFTPSPGADTYTYSWAGQLTAITDTAEDKLTVATAYPAPGTATSTTAGTWPATSTAITCPSAASSCETIISASGRALVLGYDGNGQLTSVTDPLGRQWTYTYTGCTATSPPTLCDLTTATDPLGNTTSYTYDTGDTSPLLDADMLTVTAPTAQSGYSGPDADPGKQTVIGYNPAGQATSLTDPMGWKTSYNYCVSQSAADCLNAATGTGLVSVTDPDGNTTVDDYDQGTLAAQTAWTGTAGTGTPTETDTDPDITITTVPSTCPSSTDTGGTDGSLLPVTTSDGDQNITTYCYDASGNTAQTTSPSPAGTGTAITTTGYSTTANLQDQDTCDTTNESSTGCADGDGPAPVTPGGVITPPSSAPPEGVTWNLYDTDGNQLYATTGVYTPAGAYEYSQTTYQLFKGNSITLNSTGVSCTYSPPSASLPCATIDADGVVTQLGYNNQGDLIQSSTPDGNTGGELATTTWTRDPDGEQVNETAPDGNIAGANAGNYTSTESWNADGQERAITYGNGTGYTDTPRTTSYTYDGDGNQATVTDARGYATTTAYNPDSQATLVTNPDGDSTLTCYDGDGNTVQTVPPVGVAANSLTAASCPTSYPTGYADRLASDATVSTFNAAADMTSQTRPAPAGQTGEETTTYAYDGNGNVLTTTAPPATNGGSSQVTVNTYNAAGQLASQTTGYGTSAASTVSYCYDPNGDNTSVVYADGNTGVTYSNGTVTGLAACSTSSPWTVTALPQAGYQTSYSYDSAGELLSTVTPANTASSAPTTTSTYDPAGNLLTQTDPDGVTATCTYSPLGEVTSVLYSGSSVHSVSYTYDASGNQTGMTDATGTSSNVYDQFGELTSAENGAGQAVTYGYNADGQVTGISYPLPSTATWATSDTVSYGYDEADELTSVTDFNGHQISIGNTADGLPDSVGLGSTGDTIATTYDNTDNPSAITLKNSSATLQSFTYADSPASTVLSETDTPSSSNSPADYTYDARGRVTSMTPGTGTAKSYGFDASGNLTTLPTGATGTYNDAGELTSSALSGTTTDYTYNADGEQLTSTQGSTTESSATWNGAQELATFDNSAADITAATYNGNGVRTSTTITPSAGSAVTQGYVWNTVPQVPQLLMDGTSAYIYDGGTAPAEQLSLASGTITYLNTDSLGSVRGTISSAGTLTGTTSYDAWGNPETAGGLTTTTPFGYAGGYTDPDGLIYLINRYYNPASGQFISVDPDLAETLQPYAYGAGNPVSLSDPSGLYIPNAPGMTDNASSDDGSTLTYKLDNGEGFNTPAYNPPTPMWLSIAETIALGLDIDGGTEVEAVDLMTRALEAGDSIAEARRIGLEGEELAQIDQAAKVRIPSLTGSAAYRVPDELTATALKEVKNVSKLNMTSQLRDFLEYCQKTGRTFTVIVREDTTLSARVTELRDEGKIIIDRLLPGR
jgi:RHS repeat-associated protein